MYDVFCNFCFRIIGPEEGWYSFGENFRINYCSRRCYIGGTWSPETIKTRTIKYLVRQQQQMEVEFERMCFHKNVKDQNEKFLLLLRKL